MWFKNLYFMCTHTHACTHKNNIVNKPVEKFPFPSPPPVTTVHGACVSFPHINTNTYRDFHLSFLYRE